MYNNSKLLIERRGIKIRSVTYKFNGTIFMIFAIIIHAHIVLEWTFCTLALRNGDNLTLQIRILFPYAFA